LNWLLGWIAPGREAELIGDQGAIDDLYRRHRFRIIVAITLGYGLSYTCRVAIGVVKKPMIDAGIFSAADFGLIGSALFYSYAFGKLTNGFIADHVNVKRFFAIGLALSALCNFGMGFSTTVVAATMLWGLNGWFQSFGAPASVVSLANWFSNRERGTFYGIWASSHSVGEGLTFLVIGWIIALAGWRFGYFVPAGIGLVTALGVFLWLQDRPSTFGLPKVADWRKDHWQADAHPEGRPVFLTQLSILKIPGIWVIALSSAMAYVTRYAMTSWGVLYLQEARHYSLPAAGSLMFASTLSGIAGAIAFGYVSDRLFHSRRPPANLIFGLIEIAGLLLVFYGPTNTFSLGAGLVLFGLGMTGLFTSIGGLFATDLAPKRAAGAALGLVGVFSYLGAAIQENVSGELIQRGQTMVGGVRHYDFGPAIQFWIGASVVSLLLAATQWRARMRE
jgi:OPA family sugar phosphate sensor protein UhpC-like MFS transporter